MVFERIDYPSLFVIAVVGVVLFTVAFALDALGMPSTAGFFTIYGAVAFLLSGVGYGSLFLIKAVSKTLQRRRIGV